MGICRPPLWYRGKSHGIKGGCCQLVGCVLLLTDSQIRFSILLPSLSSRFCIPTFPQLPKMSSAASQIDSEYV